MFALATLVVEAAIGHRFPRLEQIVGHMFQSGRIWIAAQADCLTFRRCGISKAHHIGTLSLIAFQQPG